MFVLVTESRHGDKTVYVYNDESEALEAYDEYEITHDGDSKTLYKKDSESAYCSEIKYEWW